MDCSVLLEDTSGRGYCVSVCGHARKRLGLKIKKWNEVVQTPVTIFLYDL